jgi:hypothetical protein
MVVHGCEGCFPVEVSSRGQGARVGCDCACAGRGTLCKVCRMSEGRGPWWCTAAGAIPCGCE